MTGEDKFQKMGKKLKADVAKKEAVVEKTEEQVKQELAIRQEKVKQMLAEDAKTEAQESGASLPFLSLYIMNRSTSLLADGKTPNDGWFYYTKTQEQFERPLVHICHISRGFRVLKKDDKGEMIPKYMHIVSGVLAGDVSMPFFLTIGGSQRLERLWEFRDLLRKQNNKGVPAYSMMVELSSENVKIKKPDGQPGMAKVINFDISKTNGEIDVIDDYSLIMELRDATQGFKKYEAQYMERYEVDEDGQKVVTPALVESVEEESPLQLPKEVKKVEEQMPESPSGDDGIPF